MPARPGWFNFPRIFLRVPLSVPPIDLINRFRIQDPIEWEKATRDAYRRLNKSSNFCFGKRVNGNLEKGINPPTLCWFLLFMVRSWKVGKNERHFWDSNRTTSAFWIKFEEKEFVVHWNWGLLGSWKGSNNKNAAIWWRMSAGIGNLMAHYIQTSLDDRKYSSRSRCRRHKVFLNEILCLFCIKFHLLFDVVERVFSKVFSFTEHLKSEASIINAADEKRSSIIEMWIVIEARGKSDKEKNVEWQGFAFFIV